MYSCTFVQTQTRQKVCKTCSAVYLFSFLDKTNTSNYIIAVIWIVLYWKCTRINFLKHWIRSKNFSPLPYYCPVVMHNKSCTPFVPNKSHIFIFATFQIECQFPFWHRRCVPNLLVKKFCSWPVIALKWVFS